MKALYRHRTVLFVTILFSISLTATAQELPLSGTFVGGDDAHPAAGSFEIREGEEGRVLSFSEDFSTRRGPDLFVWLVQGDDTENRYVVQRLQSARGAQTYALPEVDLSEYDRVLVWCRAFSVRFATGEFSSGSAAE